MQETKEVKHTALGGSAIERAIACPASIIMQMNPNKTLPEVESLYASRGTNMHLLAEQTIISKLRKIKNPDDKTVIEDIKLSDTDKSLTQGYIDYILNDLKSTEALKLFIEPKLYSDLNKQISGSIDALVVNKDSIFIVDLKTGFIQKRADDKQLYLYALLVYQNREKLGIKLKSFDMINLVIYQTSSFRKDKVVCINLKELLKFETDIKKTLTRLKELAIIAKNGGDMPEVKRGDHCKFCKVKDWCTLGGR